MSDTQALLEINNLRTYFDTREGTVKAVDGLTVSLGEGETLGLVGESGSGKSVTSLSIMRLLPGNLCAGSRKVPSYLGRDLVEAAAR
ncbi:MAG: hypothetical protein R3C02_17950 [Planctomycetaceae bacterium]